MHITIKTQNILLVRNHDPILMQSHILAYTCALPKSATQRNRSQSRKVVCLEGGGGGGDGRQIPNRSPEE
ncbi:Protein of unknown function, partial [Gryllus bimaculatus]